LARATLNGLAGRVVARGPPAAHPWFRGIFQERSLRLQRKRLFRV